MERRGGEELKRQYYKLEFVGESGQATSSALTGTFPSRGRQGLRLPVTKSLPLEGKVARSAG